MTAANLEATLGNLTMFHRIRAIMASDISVTDPEFIEWANKTKRVANRTDLPGADIREFPFSFSLLPDLIQPNPDQSPYTIDEHKQNMLHAMLDMTTLMVDTLHDGIMIAERSGFAVPESAGTDVHMRNDAAQAGGFTNVFAPGTPAHAIHLAWEQTYRNVRGVAERGLTAWLAAGKITGATTAAERLRMESNGNIWDGSFNGIHQVAAARLKDGLFDSREMRDKNAALLTALDAGRMADVKAALGDLFTNEADKDLYAQTGREFLTFILEHKEDTHVAEIFTLMQKLGILEETTTLSDINSWHPSGEEYANMRKFFKKSVLVRLYAGGYSSYYLGLKGRH